MKFLLLSIVILLQGCAWMTPRAFDSTEYNYAIQTTVMATRAVHLCGNVEHKQEFEDFMKVLNQESMFMIEYETHKDSNKNVIVGVTQTRQLVATMIVHNAYSTQYCFHKLSEVQASARTIARSLGGLEEFDICKSNVWGRFEVYEASYKANKISKLEFDELVNDLVSLQKVDHSSCSMQQKNSLANAVQSVLTATGLAGTVIGL